MGRLFGTDGVRGVANSELTPELAFALGKASVQVLKGASIGSAPTVLIGKDTRLSGDMLEDALSAGILSVGGNVIKAGVIPTPAVAWLVRKMGADCGAVISASHNPFEYNGIKLFNSDGFKLDDAIEARIEDSLSQDEAVDARAASAHIGRILEHGSDACAAYAAHLLSSFKADISGMRIVADCAHGAACGVAKTVFDALGAEMVYLGDAPDGVNINDRVGSTHPAALQAAVLAEKADIGLAFDGDADRLIAVDEKGGLLDGDRQLYICGRHLNACGKLHNNLITATVMSNIGLGLALKKEGIRLQASNVGDRYVLEMMQATGSVLGGEQSGHLIFLEDNTTGDGLFAALKLIETLADSGVPASEAASGLVNYPQVLKNARVKNEYKNHFKNDPEIAIAIEKIEGQLADEGRILIRSSGTEPLIRVMLEGADQDFLDAAATNLAELIEKKLGG